MCKDIHGVHFLSPAVKDMFSPSITTIDTFITMQNDSYNRTFHSPGPAGSVFCCQIVCSCPDAQPSSAASSLISILALFGPLYLSIKLESPHLPSQVTSPHLITIHRPHLESSYSILYPVWALCSRVGFVLK